MLRRFGNSKGAQLIAKTILDFATAAFHYAPFKSGLSSLSFNAPINRLIKSIPGTVKARLRDGNFIEVSTDDYHGRVLYLFGTNDPKVEQTARRFCNPAMCSSILGPITRQ